MESYFLLLEKKYVLSRIKYYFMNIFERNNRNRADDIKIRISSISYECKMIRNIKIWIINIRVAVYIEYNK